MKHSFPVVLALNVIAILILTHKPENAASTLESYRRQYYLTLGKYLTIFLRINKVVFFCTIKFILQDHSLIGPYWFCLSWLWGRGLCSVSDKFPLVFSYDRYSFEYGVWKYSSIKPRISNLIYVCILSLNTNSCAHIHLSHVWPSTAVQDFIYTNKCSLFMGNRGWRSRSFETHMHFSSLTCTNKKRKNTDKPGLKLLTFRVGIEWLENLYFWPPKIIKQAYVRKITICQIFWAKVMTWKSKKVF